MALSSFRLIVLFLGVCLFAFESEAITFAEIYFSNITENSGTFNDDLVNSVVLDSQNATYITGAAEGGLYTANATGGTDLIVGKYIAAPNGNLTRVWGQQIGSANGDVGFKILLSSDESKLFVAGTYDNSPALFELNATTGEVIQSISYTNYTSISTFIPRFVDMTFCGTDAICAVGSYPISASPAYSNFAVKFDISGLNFTILWDITELGVTSSYSSVACTSGGRLFIGGEVSLPGVGREFYLREINVATGVNVTQRIWPGTTCGSRENYITDIAVDEANNTLYFIGSSNQEFYADGTPSAECDFSSAIMAAGSLNMNDFSQVHWMYNLSALADGGLVETTSLSLGQDGYLYIVGDSDAADLLGQKNTAFEIGGGYFDWYLITLDGSTGLMADFIFQGDPSYIIDDKTGCVNVNTAKGRIAIGYNTGGSKYDINIRLGSNSPESFASPSPAASASPSTPPPAESSPAADSNLPLIVGVVLGSAVVGLVGLVLFFIIKKRKDEEKRRKRGSQIRPDPESANSVRLSVLEGINRNSALLQDNWNINYQEIELGAEIGRGAYGTVFRGKWRGSTVAVKQLNLEKTDQRAIDDFVKEASAVKRLRNHRNVCQIFGVCADPTYPICIVMEYMEDGNLQNLVYKGKVQLDVDAVLSMAKHTASGMSHLHSENILHCDLACRNLLVSIGKGNKYLVKISDFGMARVVENEKIYNASSEAQFPVRWSAPEVLSSGTVSRKSDVWSFGVTVWEMIEGVKPYYELASNKEVIEYVVVNGYRLPRPKKVEIPTALWEILNQCWSTNPAERPEFDEILKKLSNMKKMLRASSRGTPHDVTVTGAQPKPTGEIKPGGETYLTISEFKKKETEPVNSDEEYNTLGEKKNSNNNTRPNPPPKVVEEEDTYNKVNVKLTAQDVNGEDDYKAVIHLKAESQQPKHKPAVSQSDDDTYNKINFKNEFAAQNGNNNADESDYTQINKPNFGGPAQPAKASPPPRVVEESDYTARVNVSNEFASNSQASNSDDYSTVRLNTTQAKAKQQQQPVEEDNYSKVVLKSNSSSNNDESDYNVINFNNQNDRKQSNVQDLYLNNKK